LQQYFELGTSLESRPELAGEQSSFAEFERAVLLRDMIVRLFLHYHRGKNIVSAEASVPVRLADLYGIPDQANNRSLPLHSAALDAKDIVLHVRQPSDLLDLHEQLPLQRVHLQGKDLLSTPIKCVSNQDGLDGLFVDPMIDSKSSSGKFHELLIECKWSKQGATTRLVLQNVQSKLNLLREQGDRGKPIRSLYD